MNVRLLEGDAVEQMQTLEAASIDSCVTDPPYGLEFMSVAWDTFKDGRKGGERVPNTWGDHGSKEHPRNAYETAHIAAKKNRAFGEFSQAWAIEVLRVLKPGGYLLAFGGTRTYHRLTCAIEDSGLQVRDCLMWLHGQGFPKGKGQLKPAWEPIVLARKPAPAPWLNVDGCRIDGVAERPGTTPPTQTNHHAYGDRIRVPYQPNTAGRWPANCVLSHNPDCLVTAQRPIISAWESYENLCDSCAERAAKNEKPATPGTRASTATKRVEPTTNGREKLSRLDTSRAGTGCSDGMKAGSTSISSSTEKSGRMQTDLFLTGSSSTTSTRTSKTTGSQTCSSCGEPITQRTITETRLSPTQPTESSSGCAPECAVRLLDEQSGVLRSGGKAGSSYQQQHMGTYTPGPNQESAFFGSSGGASRFFFTAKASPSERRPYNDHPTVKPLALMQWLVRLVTPAGGTVLDPFCGSGTTLIAADREGFDAIGIDSDPHAIEITRRRVTEDAKLFAEVTV